MRHLLTSVVAAVAIMTCALQGCGTSDAEIVDGVADGGQDDAFTGDGGPVDCGGITCPAGQACVGGKCTSTCPAYTSLCNGVCIPTVADPNNCGGCGIACTGTLACAGGKCSDTCLPGTDKCGNTCADKKSDNNHCGTCGNICPMGQGCVDGACAPVVPVNPPPPGKCPGGGPPPTTGVVGDDDCLGKLAQTVFRWAICSCKDVQFSGNYLTDGFDSTKGPYVPGGLGAGVGANENYGTSGTADVGGTLWIAGTGGINASLKHDIRTDTRAGGQLGGSAQLAIMKDAYAEGDVSSGGALTIGGNLFLPASANVSGNVTVAGNTTRQPVVVLPPCDFCEPAQQVPVVAAVAAHRPPNNDNALIGLDANAFASPSTPLRLDLPCGSYYLTRVASSAHVTIAAHGRTALYIDGDVSPNGLTFAVDPGAELDVFVLSSIATSGTVKIGSPGWPAAMRVYVAGTAGFAISGDVRIAGNLYAPNGAVQYSSNSEQFGSIYGGNFATSKDLAMHYDLAVVTAAGAPCDGPAPGSDAGTPPPPAGCGSCKDCGGDACINGKCDMCTSSAQCCPPLVCAGGKCVPSVN